ncbi:MAG: ABC transporter ATP-binding protein [Chitinophagaceae bacterium]|nr:ABC transporter ATP-binding protein [Chitinophagaceae bacterium]
MSAVSISHIYKTYGKKKEVTALTDISFEVTKGELFGIIGPDGAGKTSLFRILTTLLLADKGEATVDGFDVVKDFKSIRKRVGYMPGKFSLYPDLTVEENLNFFATIFNTSIKEKLALSCALIHKPSVLFLDEPTTGVDAVSRKEFWGMLKSLKEQGITILVSTPYMDEASMCDRVALLQKGSIMAIDTPKAIVEAFAYDLWAVKAPAMLPLLRQLHQFDKIIRAYPSGVYHHVVVPKGFSEEILKEFLVASKIEGWELHKQEPNIEDCFMSLMTE